jgi:Tol biopolymer transport system component
MDVDHPAAPVPLPGQDTTRNNSWPDWSPDGKTIVFVCQLASEQRALAKEP